MQRLLKYCLLLLLIATLAACSASTPTAQAPTSTPKAENTSHAATPTDQNDPFFQSTGGGEPRSTGYWLLWNSCAPDNKAEIAAANGGRQAGWIIVDDLLAAPGILLGELTIDSCQLAINLLQAQDSTGVDHSADTAYNLAAQLLAAQLNLAASAEYCPAVDEAVRAGQLLLIQQGFDASGGYFSVVENNQDRQAADFLVEQLVEYNAGSLCR